MSFRLYLVILTLFSIQLFAKDVEHPTPRLSINIFSWKNGVGLQQDMNILKEALEDLGQEVHCYDYKSDQPENADINIFFEDFCPKQFSKASVNYFVPNPEWYTHSVDDLDAFDLILCRTREGERIFNGLGKPTFYLGFTSIDCFQYFVLKDYHQYLHVAGRSTQKGTRTLTSIWKQTPSFPQLILLSQIIKPGHAPKNIKWITERVPLNTLRFLQNHSGVHLCTSETEGFGHYLVEAMSTKSVIITTDAPPMNEFITDKRCLVAYNRTSSQRLGINYHIDPEQLSRTIKKIQKLSPRELSAIGEQNRVNYLKRKKEFLDNLRILMEIALNPRESRD